MSISAAEVKQLRERTGAGMMDCKKALKEADGDLEVALDWLRKKGQKVAAKRADRDANEGVVVALTTEDGKTGIVLAVSSETDFVAKNDGFIALANSLGQLALEKMPANKEEFIAMAFDDNVTVAEKLVEETGKIGEKLEVSDLQLVKGDNIASYIHAGSKIGVVVSFKDGGSAEAPTFFRNVAMHIAAMSPQIMRPEEFDEEFVLKETEALQGAIKVENEDRERLGKPLRNVPQFASKRQLTPEVMAAAEDAIKAELAAEGKPEKIWDRIVPGKMERFVADNTLLDQERCLLSQFFALDDTITVENAIKNLHPEAELIEFKRVAVG
ncbi:MAG: translation elongation factor Ts [Mariniblastus sp.]|nr:translation elongation factor Ts [Mariniblastus sp.]